MKTDKIFYILFQLFPGLLFELMGETPPADVQQVYEFTAVELKELAKRIDGILCPKENFPNRPLYFLEVQFQEDEDFYWRLLTEVFIYFGQYKPNRDWQAVVVWADRSLDPGVPIPYRTLLASDRIVRIYLDELDEEAPGSIGLGIVQLVVAGEEKAIGQVPRLIQQAQQEFADAALRRTVLELIETVVIYKFSNKSREELEAMFGVSDITQTRFYREVKEKGELEGKLKSVPDLLKEGLTVEQIARALKLDVETVRQAGNPESSQDTTN